MPYKDANGQDVPLNEIRRRNPKTSIPEGADVSPLGFYYYEDGTHPPAPDPADLRDQRTREVKVEAHYRILRRFPDWKQANMTARGVELSNIRHDRPWTAEEQAEADALQQDWDWIKAVRRASGAIEARLPEDVDELLVFDVAAQPEWP